MKRICLLVLILVLAMLPMGSVAAQAETYGEHHALYGDLNLDRKIDASDALEVLRLLVGKSENDRMLPAADVNRDGRIGADDALEILKHTVGKPTVLDTPESVTVHMWSQWQEVQAATQAQDGILRRDCQYCSAYEEKTVAYLPPIPAMCQEVLRLVNAERAKEGLQPLAYYTEGQPLADIRANEINTLFEHTRPDGSSCFTVFPHDLPWYALGENIAMGQTTPDGVMVSWMNSPGHRENILDSQFTHIIVGAVPCEHEGYRGYCWVQLFLGLSQ